MEEVPPQGHPVKLFIYDLSGGQMAELSDLFLGEWSGVEWSEPAAHGFFSSSHNQNVFVGIFCCWNRNLGLSQRQRRLIHPKS